MSSTRGLRRLQGGALQLQGRILFLTSLDTLPGIDIRAPPALRGRRACIAPVLPTPLAHLLAVAVVRPHHSQLPCLGCALAQAAHRALHLREGGLDSPQRICRIAVVELSCLDLLFPVAVFLVYFV